MALQLKLGQSSQLDANLAQSAYSSALNATTVARQFLTQSRQAYLIAMGRNGPMQTQGQGKSSGLKLPKLLTNWQPPTDAYKVALESRPDLSALRSKLTQSTAQADLASVSRIPDISLSAMTGREAGENLIKFGITIPFPVLN
ncbi:MAG: TolC family protein, partial [Mariprofundus sp.]